jgi:RNA polymerase sigma factor (sigma-70 family)
VQRVEDTLSDLRRRAFAIAYRMLGSVSEAEDVAQEALLRYHRAQLGGEQIGSPPAFVATIATRLAIDALRSARRQREQYVGDWLPEPLLTAQGDDPAERAQLADSLSLAFLVLLERLTPEQRAAFLLREVFDYPYEEIAEIVGRSEQAARQLASRARRQLESERPRYRAAAEQREELAARFFEAVEEGDLAGLESLLADDVELRGDGGGKAPALGHTLVGRSRVARTLRNWGRVAQRVEGFVIERTEINARQGALFRGPGGVIYSALMLETDGERIVAIHGVTNPDKLGHLGQTADTWPLVRRDGS